jgi:hypothetical protein
MSIVDDVDLQTKKDTAHSRQCVCKQPAVRAIVISSSGHIGSYESFYGSVVGRSTHEAEGFLCTDCKKNLNEHLRVQIWRYGLTCVLLGYLGRHCERGVVCGGSKGSKLMLLEEMTKKKSENPRSAATVNQGQALAFIIHLIQRAIQL